MPCDVPVLISEIYYTQCITHVFLQQQLQNESCSCPHYHRYTTNFIPILTLLPWLIPIPGYNVIVPITAVITTLNAVLPLSPSPCHSLTL